MAGKRRLVLRIALGLAAVGVIAALGAYAWLQHAPRRVPAGQPPLATIEAGSLSGLRHAFNAGRGEIRILALLSPT